MLLMIVSPVLKDKIILVLCFMSSKLSQEWKGIWFVSMMLASILGCNYCV